MKDLNCHRKFYAHMFMVLVTFVVLVIPVFWYYMYPLPGHNKRYAADGIHIRIASVPSNISKCHSNVDIKETGNNYVGKANDDNNRSVSVLYKNFQDDAKRITHAEIEAIVKAFIANYSKTVSIVSCQEPAFVTLMINSAARNFGRRQSIRRTWGNPKEFEQRLGKKNVWKTVFIIGRTGEVNIDKLVDEEAKKYGDLIVAQIHDNFKGLTDKTVLGMYWSRQVCKAKFYYKGDDDVWINKWRLFDYIIKLSIDSNFDSGNCWVGRVADNNRDPIRNKHSKYYVSYRDFPGSQYPPYCSGFGHLMAADTVDKMLVSIPKIRKLQSIEDVYVGLLANTSGVRPVTDHRFLFEKVQSVDKLFQIIAEHGVLTSKLMIKFHTIVRDKYIEFIKLS